MNFQSGCDGSIRERKSSNGPRRGECVAGRENLLSRVDYDCMTVKLVVASGGEGSCRKRAGERTEEVVEAGGRVA